MMPKPLVNTQAAALQEKVQSDAIAAEFPPMTEAERKALLKAELNKKILTAREERERLKRECVGQIYIIGSECGTYPYKIGLSKSGVKQRIDSMQTSHWATLKVFFESSAIPQVETVEKLLHKKYSKKRIRGEWFRLTKRDINYIIQNLNVFVVEAQVKAQVKNQKKIDEENKRKEEKEELPGYLQIKQDREMRNYLIEKGVPVTILTENHDKYIIPHRWTMKKIVVDAVVRSNRAYMERHDLKRSKKNSYRFPPADGL
jgi:hypothetical protein